jgi:hypothetical protein
MTEALTSARDRWGESKRYARPAEGRWAIIGLRSIFSLVSSLGSTLRRPPPHPSSTRRSAPPGRREGHFADTQAVPPWFFFGDPDELDRITGALGVPR